MITENKNINEYNIIFIQEILILVIISKKQYLVGFQHQNKNLQRNTFLGNISPITGGFITENSAAYIYTGVQANYNLGKMKFTPSFAPGLYHEGDGKDLGHALEFKTEVQLSYSSSEVHDRIRNNIFKCKFRK